MFDFYFSGPPKTLEEEIRYLVAVKRNLPRWCNSLPDAEFIAICELLYTLGKRAEEIKRPFVLVETGVGASSLALAYYAIKHQGIAYSWDINTEKGSVMRTACTETMCTIIDRNINRHWKLIGYDTLSPYAGLTILQELTDHVDFTLHDSQHVWEILQGELSIVHRLLKDGSVVAIDDAYYNFRHTDTAYINLVRKKLDLSPIPQLAGNQSRPFFEEVEQFLKGRFGVVRSLSEGYKARCRSDISISYFGGELEARSSLGMQQVNNLEDRFACWTVQGKID